MDNKLNYTEENEEREDGKLSYRTPIYLQLPMAHYPKLFDVVHKRLNHLAQY